MNSPLSNYAAQEGNELLIIRTLAAPRAMVFQAFAEAERLAAWWGPAGCRLEVRQLDFRPGGRFLYGMHMAGAPVMWGKFEYREISAPERIVFINSFADEAGNTIRAPFSETWPLQMLNVLTLAENGPYTELTLRVQPLQVTTEEEHTFISGFESMRQGFSGTFDRLVTYLAAAN